MDMHLVSYISVACVEHYPFSSLGMQFN